MARISLAGFKDPLRRPRYIIWTGVTVLLLASVVIVALGVTSSYWFCSSGCHKVQDDTITAYNASTHSEISCMACHMPAGAGPVTFMLHKAEALIELYMTLADKFELPLNAHSHVAMEMSSKQCTQCHSANREVTPSEGVIIDHKVHEENEVHCTYCHNRVGHNEKGLTFKGVDPHTKKTNHAHEDFMEMTACFRCHSLDKATAKAPGECSKCHPKGFKLKPENHEVKDFVNDKAVETLARHAQLGKKDHEGVEEAEAEEAEKGAEKEGSGHGEESKWELKPVGAVSYCGTCHVKSSFCDSCHGMEMPHPEEFKTKKHPEVVKTSVKKCEMCHLRSKSRFCDDCHHGKKVGWTFDAKSPWKTQHAKAVTSKGVKGCLGDCHDEKFCADCHMKLKPVPSSHKQKTWLHDEYTVSDYGKAKAKPTAMHARSAAKERTACEVCHGKGGTKAKFCADCHRIEMPHPSTFAEFHAGTGRKDPKLCQNCHTFNEVCSNCHHSGASFTRSWTSVHPDSVRKNEVGGCFKKCHKDKTFCVDCHTKSNALPSSHKAADWTRRTDAKVDAKHQVAYKKAVDSCSYCHGDGGVKARFCSNCHKIEMPHPRNESEQQKFLHKEGFAKKALSKDACRNCHSQAFCDDCHHPGSTPKVPWAANKAGVNVQHKAIVVKKGTSDCFKSCHQETFCSYCHVRLR